MNIFKPLSQTILGDPNLRFLKPTQPYFITRKRNEYQEFIHLETHTGTSLTEPDGMEPSKSYEDSSVPYFQWVRDRQRLTINSISLVSGLPTSHADKYVDPNDISYVMLTENVTPSAAQQQPGLSTSQPVNPDKLKDHDHSPPSTPILPLTVTENTVPDISLQHDDMAVDVTTSKARGVVQTIPFESPSISASPATHHDNSDDVDPSPWKQLDDYEVVRDVILEEYRDLSRRSSPKPESSVEKLGPDPESESRNEYFPDNEPGEAPPSSPRIYSTTKSQKGTFDERYTKSGHTDWIYRSATMKAYEPAGVNEFRLMASEMEHVWPKTLELGSNSFHMVRPSAYTFWQDQDETESADMIVDTNPVTSFNGLISYEEYKKRLAQLKFEKEREESELEEKLQCEMLNIQEEYNIAHEAISQSYERDADELQLIWETQHLHEAQCLLT